MAQGGWLIRRGNKGSAAQNWNSHRKTGICIADQELCRSFGDSHRIQPSLSLRRRVVRDYHPPPTTLLNFAPFKPQILRWLNLWGHSMRRSANFMKEVL